MRCAEISNGCMHYIWTTMRSKDLAESVLCSLEGTADSRGSDSALPRRASSDRRLRGGLTMLGEMRALVEVEALEAMMTTGWLGSWNVRCLWRYLMTVYLNTHT